MGWVMNKYPSQHWVALFFTLLIPSATVIMNVLLDVFDVKTPSGNDNMTALTMLYVGVAMWWILALVIILPGNPNITKDAPKFGRWLLLLPVSIIIINCFTPFDSYTERIAWFNAVAVTWVGMILWILVDWYRWKFNPSVRQQDIIFIRNHVAKRKAEIDRIPDCVVPSDLSIQT